MYFFIVVANFGFFFPCWIKVCRLHSTAWQYFILFGCVIYPFFLFLLFSASISGLVCVPVTVTVTVIPLEFVCKVEFTLNAVTYNLHHS